MSAKFAKYLANLGYGTRREVVAMFNDERVRRRDGAVLAADDQFEHDNVLVDDEPLDPPPNSVVMLHKPAGYVCSTSEASQLVYDLLPSRFRERSPLMSPVGRLDRDTTGLLLLTDDGQLNHRLTSPRMHVPKTYRATLATALTGDEVERFASGTLLLENDEVPLKPALLRVVEERVAEVVVSEGRYHQVRRMFAAVGNHVEALARTRIGALTLGDVREGEWRVLSPSELALPFQGEQVVN